MIKQRPEVFVTSGRCWLSIEFSKIQAKLRIVSAQVLRHIPADGAAAQ